MTLYRIESDGFRKRVLSCLSDNDDESWRHIYAAEQLAGLRNANDKLKGDKSPKTKHLCLEVKKNLFTGKNSPNQSESGMNWNPLIS